MNDDEKSLKERLRLASAEFQARGRRHQLKTKNVIYCSFTTEKFSVSPNESQRDAAKRLLRFGVGLSDFNGKSVLDLGCNNGAMLFEISRHMPSKCLGVEYDADKVILAKDIALFCGLTNIEFRCQDLDAFDASAFVATEGKFDVVLCLAIEKHVKNVDKLYEVLSLITGDLLLFEANSGTESDDIIKRLCSVGFANVKCIGFCDDDIRPSNNRRPLFTARKLS